jgi:fermentation-respiration switch protein FrsA (DUF1100 family)
VILEAPFLSIEAMARRYYPWIPAALIRLRFDNGAKIGHLAVPKLFVEAERDDVVPPEQTRRLFELAPPPKTLYVIPRAVHTDAYLVGGAAYLEACKRFLDEAVR